MASVRTSCHHCGAVYGGKAGHCRGCCRTFASDSAFDAHLASRVHGGCLDPATVTTKDGRPKLAWNPRRAMWQGAGVRPSRQACPDSGQSSPPRPSEGLGGIPVAPRQPYAVLAADLGQP